MRMNLKEVTKTDKFFMMSIHGYGLCLYKITDTSYDHGIECLNLFTSKIEFHHYLDDDDGTKVLLVSDEDVRGLIKMYNE